MLISDWYRLILKTEISVLLWKSKYRIGTAMPLYGCVRKTYSQESENVVAIFTNLCVSITSFLLQYYVSMVVVVETQLVLNQLSDPR